MDQEITSLEQLLERISKVKNEEGKVSFEEILDKVGRKSFAPLLLLAGLVTLAPIIGDIPGMPTLMAIFVVLTAVQLLLQKEHFWLPDWLLKRSVSHEKLAKALDWMKRPAKYFDKVSHSRLDVLTKGGGMYVIAISCILIALAMPVMEFIPFSANGAGAALTAFGLSLISQDGYLALFALLVTATTFGVIIYNLV